MMEQCPQCGLDRIAEDVFCHKCGHKHIVPPEPESANKKLAIKSESPIEETQDSGETRSEQLAAIWIQIPNTPNTYPIYFENLPKVLKRQDFADTISQSEDTYQISRKQCTMSMDSGGYYMEDGATQVQDRPSTNHTTINGQDITGKGRIMLNDGDKIVFAHLVHAVFRMDGV